MTAFSINEARVDRLVADAVRDGLLEAGLGRRVRLAARLLPGRLLSGQALADALGVSRAAVHKHAIALRAAGLQVDPVPGAGYQVRAWEDLLVPEVVIPLLLSAGEAPTRLGLPYLYSPEVDSTNRVLKEGAQRGLPSGGVAVTDHQVGGRGRLGRSWVSQAGKDLTFSSLLRPAVLPAHAPRLVLAAATAVAEAIDALGLEGRVGIKWPNDVLVDGRKVCGILSEVAMDMDRLHWVVIGIGLNVNGRPADNVPPESLPPGRLPPASLADCTGTSVSRAPLLVDLLGRLAERWRRVEEGGWPQVREACVARDVLLGRQVTVRTGGASVVEGVAAGFGPEGELLVRRADGSVGSLIAGEATLS